MSKNKKNKKSKNKSRPGLSSGQVIEKYKESSKRGLRERLDEIYNSVDLSTTGCVISICGCACCNVAMPQMNYCEFVQLATDLWNDSDTEKKLSIISKSIEYFLRNEYEKWGMDSLVKPCQFVDKFGRCGVYKSRPASCRIYALWPEDDYERRVDKFAKAYEQYGLKKEDLPLAKQCKMVTRSDGSNELKKEEIDLIFDSLDRLDKKVGDFSDLQIKEKENYRTFHDWLLLKIFGEEWLSLLTNFMLSASKEQMQEQVSFIVDAIKENFDIDSLKI